MSLLADRRRIIFLIVLMATLLFAALLLVSAVQWMQFTSVKARIVKIEAEDYDSTDDIYMGRYYYITYSYVYKGEKYQTPMKVFSAAGHTEGDVVTIKIDPKSPGTVFFAYRMHALLAIFAFLIVFEILLYLIICRDSSANATMSS